MDAIELLRTIPLFAKLNDSQLAALAALAKPEHYFPLQPIAHQGDLGNRFFIIAQGTVNLRQTTVDGAEKSIGVLAQSAPTAQGSAPKNYFGAQMFTSQEPYDSNVDAITEVEVYSIHRQQFDELVQTRPDIAHALDFVRAAERARTRGFQWIAEGEAVSLLAHKHWWALVLALTPIAVIALVFVLADVSLGFLIPRPYVTTLIVTQFLLIAPWAVYRWYDWANDKYIVTNQRIAHIERVLLNQELRETVPIDKVLSVTLEKSGFAGIFLDVGTLIIQSAGRAEGNVTFSYLANVERVQKAIQKQQQAIRARQVAEEREWFRSAVRGELRESMMPDLVAEERAVVGKPKAKPKAEMGTWDALRRFIHAALNLEIHYEDRTVWRKHWVVLIRQAGVYVLFLIALDLLFALVAFAGAANTAFMLVGGVIFLALFLRLLWEWADWSNDVYTVTESQIIDSERLPFGLRERTTIAPLDQVQDIRVEVPSPFAYLFNYGDVKIETAGTAGQMIFHSIHGPREAQEEIYRRLMAYREKRMKEEASVRSASVVDAILAYHRLQKDEERLAQSRSADAPEEAESNSTSPAESADRIGDPNDINLGPEIFD